MHTQWVWFHHEGEQNYALFRMWVQPEIFITRKLDQTQNDKNHVFHQLWVLGFTQIHKFIHVFITWKWCGNCLAKQMSLMEEKEGLWVIQIEYIQHILNSCHEICYVEWIDTNFKYFCSNKNTYSLPKNTNEARNCINCNTLIPTLRSQKQAELCHFRPIWST